VVVDLRSPLPPYYQVARQLETAVGDGRLKVGDRLPPTKDLAAATGLCRTTIISAIGRLVERGLVARGRRFVVIATPAGTPKAP
jgi:DNA-binding GntR family transcriptional regulator